MNKTCSVCHVEKPLADFTSRTHICKPCKAVKSRERDLMLSATDRDRWLMFHIRKSMIKRCHSQASTSYRYYGARGIYVCERWRKSLDDFISDMGPRPSARHSVDRIDNNGPYSPENCRWATPAQQSANSRMAKPVTYKGTTMTRRKWSEYFGRCASALSVAVRSRGIPPEQILAQWESCP